MKKIGYVYLTTNLVNGKQYVGQHLATEFDKSYKGSGTAVNRAFKKYGWKNFDCKIVCWCSTQTQLNEAEDNYIRLLNTMSPNGYNLKRGGANGRHSKESCENMSKLKKKYFENEENRKKQSEGKKKQWKNEEYRKNMSEAHKGQIPWNKGRTGVYSEESRKNMGKSKIGHTPWNKGRTGVYSEESRKNMSEAQRNHPKLSKKVLQFTKDGVFVKEWASAKEIERVLGFFSSCISNCCNGKQKSAYGFIWKHPDNTLQETSSQTHE